ncbi:hypothetical protein K470DRAFT_213729, partial [Piedraia hortae CBS 480.64]
VIVAETISLGILSLPMALSTMGIIPGVILLVIFSAMSIYTGFAMTSFKIAHPQVTTFADALELICGRRVGRLLGSSMQALLLILIAAAHIVTFGGELNILTDHATCMMVFTVAGAAISWAMSVPSRTFDKAKYVAVASCISIACATAVAMGSIIHSHSSPFTAGITHPKPASSFAKGAVATSNMVLAYNGQMAYFSIMDEMEKPEDFRKSVALLGVVSTAVYVASAVVLYWFIGVDVKSPALENAQPVLRKVAYGLATPTILVAGVIPGLVAAKMICEAQGSGESTLTPPPWLVWVIVVTGIYILAWVLASVVPVFSQLLGLIGAALGTWFSLGIGGIFWLHLNWKAERDVKYWFGVAWALFVIGVCAVTCVLGVWGTAVGLQGGRVFAC